VVHQAARDVQAEKKVKLNYMVGTMIEVPRGASRPTKSPSLPSSSVSDERPHADRTRHVARRLGILPAALRLSSRS
jgi:hypothetical protein